MTLKCGTRLGPYEIVGQVGAGGMGVVYKAHDTRLKRPVAIKLLPPETTRDETAKQRFLQEAQAASALDHPNVCTIFEINDTDDGEMYLVMAYYDGETVKEKIDRGPLPLDESIRIATQAAEGLGKAHAAGIVHRDIKPGNLIVTADGTTKILDFGLAKLTGPDVVTQTGSTVGTVAYMSPEQARGRDVDLRTDIWSLGVVFYEMVTGRNPFEGDNLLAISRAIADLEPSPMNATRPEVPRSVVAGVSGALAKDPDQRFASTTELLDVLRSRDAEPRVSRGTQDASVAVLSFSDMSPQKDQGFFCEGIAEEILNTLSNIEGLRVAARTSSFLAMAGGLDIAAIGSRLNVGHVLEGSIRTSGNRIRITTQLITVDDGYQLWSERYDRSMADIFDLQDEIAEAIGTELKGALTPGEQSQIRQRQTNNVDAYTLYLKGRFFWNKRTEEGLGQALNLFRQAVAVDPDYAPAHAGIADTYNLMGILWVRPPADVHPQAKQAAMRALELDERLAEAHTSLGFVYAAYDWDWEKADQEFRRAIELAPGYPTAHHFYGAYYLSPMGRHDEAIREVRRAQELDPLAPIFGADAALLLNWARREDDAIATCRETIESFPDFPLTFYYLAHALTEKGQGAEAVKAARKAESMTGDAPLYAAGLGYALAGSGDEDGARKILANLISRKNDEPVPAYHLALILARLGETDRAFEWLEQAFRERSWLQWARVEPGFDPVRPDSRFTDLVGRMNFPTDDDTAGTATTQSNRPSIAILPFANMSADPNRNISATAWPRKSSTR